jgi:hypothetical protein
VKVLSVNVARSVWLIRVPDLNPGGKYILPFLDAIKGKYGFLQHTKPSETDPTQAKPVVFRHGNFQNRSGEQKEIALNIWQDGLVADTQSSTDDSDFFLGNLLDWLTEEFGLTPYRELAMSKLYTSELWVHTEKKLVTLNPELQRLVDRINSMVREFSDKNLVFEMGAIGIWNDRTLAPNNFFSPFRFERAEVAAFAENRYYSAAPVGTRDHIMLLDELEQILAG